MSSIFVGLHFNSMFEPYFFFQSFCRPFGSLKCFYFEDGHDQQAFERLWSNKCTLKKQMIRIHERHNHKCLMLNLKTRGKERRAHKFSNLWMEITIALSFLPYDEPRTLSISFEFLFEFDLILCPCVNAAADTAHSFQKWNRYNHQRDSERKNKIYKKHTHSNFDYRHLVL